MKKSMFLTGMALILISFGVNLIYYVLHQLDEPIVLKHYYELDYREEIPVEIFYVTNRYEPVNIQMIDIPGMNTLPGNTGGFYFHQDTAHQNIKNEYRHQVLKSYSFIIDGQNLFKENNDPIAIDEVRIHFSDGTVKTADIGQLIIYKDHQEVRPLNQQMSGSSNRNLDWNIYVANKPVTIEKINYSFRNILDEDFKIKLSWNQKQLQSYYDDLMNNRRHSDRDLVKEWDETPGVNLNDERFPVQLDEGEWLGVYSAFEPEEISHNALSYFQVHVKMSGVTEDGESFQNWMRINLNPYISQKQMDHLVQMAREGDF